MLAGVFVLLFDKKNPSIQDVQELDAQVLQNWTEQGRHLVPER